MFAASKTASVSAGGYQISRSLRFNSADSAYLNRTPTTAGNLKTWTFSAWVKRSFLGTDQGIFARSTSSGSAYTGILFGSANTLIFFANSSLNFATTATFKDLSAWLHVVVVLDTTQATSTNRVKIYVNGSQITSFSTATYPSQNSDYEINTTNPHGLGRFLEYSSNWFFNGYITEVNFIDGQALTAASFGATDAQTGVWSPIQYTGGSYGTNGFYLNFSDNSNTTAATLGKDYSGNGNNWTPNNFSVTAGAGDDSLVDVPVLYGIDTGVGGTVRGNYCTWNPLDVQNSGITLANGNLDYSGGTSGFIGSRGTIGMTSGKWYWEITAGGNGNVFGIMTSLATTVGIDFYPGRDAFGWGYYGGNGNKFNNNSGTAYGATFTNGDVIGVAFDADAGTLVFYKNGTSQGTAFSSLTSGPYFPAFGESATTGSTNFGQRAFAYTAPSGYKALCTQNLPTPAVGATTATQAAKYFNPVTYTGTGSSLAITGVGFQPDWVWVKGRSGATDHALYDAVRGVQKQIETNNTNAETTESTGLTAFGSDGFTTGALAQMNTSSATYIAWNWKANGSGSTNTSGSITSTVSASTTSGFSVVTYTGTGLAGTIGHGLGVAPSMIIVKTRNQNGEWPIYHSTIGNGSYLNLNTTDSTITSTSIWNSTTPTSSVFSVGINATSNAITSLYVAYCFAEVVGFSKFGSYIGNSSADGPFVYLGFTPKYILIKRSDLSGTNWRIITVNTSYLSANTADAEYDSPPGPVRGVSNGVKIVGTGGDINNAGSTFIYAAFASFPFKYALAQSS